jgi:Uma2 family endonuclease
MSTAKLVTTPMDIDAFRDWASRQPGRWELVDGEPRAMAPASTTHGFIAAEGAWLIRSHLERRGGPCRLGLEPPVVPTASRRHNARAPDLAVTCSPQDPGTWEMNEPVILIEILSPYNERDTRANVWTYLSIPSVREILLLSSTELRAELLRRRPDGTWPGEPDLLGPEDEVRLDAIGFTMPLRALYATSGLAR